MSAGLLRPERIIEAALAEAEAEGGVEITENAQIELYYATDKEETVETISAFLARRPPSRD
jgi:hypothetical protein